MWSRGFFWREVLYFFYRASCEDKDYTVLNARLFAVLPDLKRFYNEGEPRGSFCARMALRRGYLFDSF